MKGRPGERDVRVRRAVRRTRASQRPAFHGRCGSASFRGVGADRIFDYVEAANPRAAIAVDERIDAQIARLRRFPATGRPGRSEGTRELVVKRTPYIAKAFA